MIRKSEGNEMKQADEIGKVNSKIEVRFSLTTK